MSSPRLAFANGSLLAARPDALHVVDLTTRTAELLPRTGLASFAVVGGEIWTASGTPLSLEIAGIAERPLLAGATGRFVQGVGAQAVWLGAGAFHLRRTENGVEMTRLAADFAMPVGANRMLACTRAAVELRDATTRWTASLGYDGRVLEGAIVFDGRAVALWFCQRDKSAIVVLDARRGVVHQRVNLVGARLVRFAPARGVALVVVENRLVLLDLRFGCVLADHVLEHAVADVAIDAAGQQIAMLVDGEEDLLTLDVEALLRAPVVQTPAVEPATPAPVETPQLPDDVPEEPFVFLDACEALPARRPIEPATPHELHAVLAAQRALVLALVAQALARAWDQGHAAPERRLSARELVDGLAGERCGLAQDEITRATARAATAAERYRSVRRAIAPRVAPLSQLATEHGLDILDQHVLLVVAAPQLWGELARLYGLLCDDAERPLCDEQLVAAILAPYGSAHDITAALAPDAPLVRSGLVEIGAGPRPFAPLTADPIALRLLRGTDGGVDARVATCAFEHLELRTSVKRRIVDELARARGPLRIVVRGRTSSGRHTLLAAIAAVGGRALAVVDAPALARGGIAALAVALRRAHLAGHIPCIDGLEHGSLRERRDELREMIRAHGGPVAIRLPPDGQPPIDPGYVAIDLPTQTTSERLASWRSAFARAGVVGDPNDLAARYAVGPGVIERVVERAAGEPEPLARIELHLAQHLDRELATIATRVDRLATWSQIVLPPDIQDSIAELLGRIRHRRTVFDTWGFDRVMSTSRGVTALFQGGPGTGKTIVASAIAHELGLELYRVDVSRIMSKWIGETEQNLAKLFDAAEDGNAIILFDEADSLFAKRTEVKSSIDRYANLEVNYLLQRLDSFEGIAILTTNFGTTIDSALKRRLSFRLTFPFPDEEQRERLWRAHLPPQLPTRGVLDLAAVSQRFRLSGGYIRNCALRAAFLAAEQGGILTADLLERAIKAEFREIGKLAESGALE